MLKSMAGSVFRGVRDRLWNNAVHRLSGGRREPLVHKSIFAMGTDVQIKLSLSGAPQNSAPVDQAVAAVADRIEAFGYQCWPWSGGALTSINNELGAGRIAHLPEDLRPLFRLAWQVHLASQGNFEPRIANLVRLWEFHDYTAAPVQPPLSSQINDCLRAIAAAPPYDGGDSYGPAPGVAWDFGGIGKGWIIDQALTLLADLGFPDAVIDAGGNLAVRGGCGARPWRVGIRQPDSDPESPRLLGSLEVRDESVNTHGDDQRYFIHQGRRYGHILDPKTGFPGQGIRSVTVVHADGSLAEAGGAALFVAGPSRWEKLASRLELDRVLVVLDSGEIKITPALAPRIRFQEGVRVTTVAGR